MRSQNPKISGVILAAGKSARIRPLKQLLPFRGKTILGQIVESALSSSLCEVIAVLGHAAEQIRQVVDFGDAKVVVNREHEQGQSTSLQAGLSAVCDQSAAVMFILGDQPLISAEVIDTLIEGYYPQRAPLVIPTFRGKRGNPVIVGRSLFHRLQSLTGDVGARALFEEYAEQIKEIEIENECIRFDIDTWEDYAKLKEIEDTPVSNRVKGSDLGPCQR
ncbi:MAG: nucleotidyltransferase family protein [Candidatus Hydrogenedentota bacterium]|nr:MAG: nucleotidyltransferase family protein [Candidatus Hydrogenedentota bacterium]